MSRAVAPTLEESLRAGWQRCRPSALPSRASPARTASSRSTKETRT